MRRHDPLRDVETQPQIPRPAPTFPSRRQSLERAEETVDLPTWDRWTVVVNCEHDLVVLATDYHGDRHLGRTVLHGISQEVGHQLTDPPTVPAPTQVARRRELHRALR